jgi:uncharacterized protein (TIRG00374 family)
MATQHDLPDEQVHEALPDEFHPRHLVIRLVELAVIVGLVAIAITALPGLDHVEQRLADASPVWLLALAAAEIGSCFGYLLVFRATFCPQMAWALTYDIAMAEQAANSLLPSGGAGGLALGVWALRQAGMSTVHIAKRTVAFFVLTSAANFVGVVVAGLGIFTGVLPGRGPTVFTLVPALIAAVVIVLAWFSPRLLRAFGDPLAGPKRATWRAGVRHAIRDGLAAAADGVDLAKEFLRSRSFGVLVGSIAYLCFDIAALGFGFVAVGAVPPLGTLLLGYLVGQLGNLVPLPGGVGGTEGALVGMFAVLHVNVTLAAAAVLAYRLFQVAIPALLGAPAFVLLRRRLARANERARVCAPLAHEMVKLPARS